MNDRLIGQMNAMLMILVSSILKFLPRISIITFTVTQSTGYFCAVLLSGESNVVALVLSIAQVPLIKQGNKIGSVVQTSSTYA